MALRRRRMVAARCEAIRFWERCGEASSADPPVASAGIVGAGLLALRIVKRESPRLQANMRNGASSSVCR